jgi:hypothetical protein
MERILEYEAERWFVVRRASCADDVAQAILDSVHAARGQWSMDNVGQRDDRGPAFGEANVADRRIAVADAVLRKTDHRRRLIAKVLLASAEYWVQRGVRTESELNEERDLLAQWEAQESDDTQPGISTVATCLETRK